MRKTRNVRSNFREELVDEFSWYFNEGEFNEIFVSIFDHWLTQEEALRELCNLPADTLAERKSVYDEFHRRLLESNQVLSVVERGRGRKRYFQFKEFVGLEEGVEYMAYNDYRLPLRCYRKILISDRKCVYVQGPDYTGQLLFLNQLDIKPLLDIAVKAGLHMLG
jgi:hypothetical protein